MSDAAAAEQTPTYVPLFADGEPIRVMDLAAATANSRPDDEDDALRYRSNADHDSDIDDDDDDEFDLGGVRWTKRQLMCAIASMDATDKIAQRIQKRIDATCEDGRGPRPDYTGFDAIMFVCGTLVCGGATALHNEIFPDPACGRATGMWDIINEALEYARPDRPDWRLTNTGFSRFEHARFRDRFLDAKFLGKLERLAMGVCADGAVRMGQFQAHAGTYTHPHSIQIVMADGTKIPGPYINGHPDKISAKTGRPKRCDRDAFTPNGVSPKPDDPATNPYYEWCILVTRSPYTQERIVLGIRVKGEALRGISDATLSVDLLIRLLAERPDLIVGLYGFAYDMAISAEDKERLLKAGVQPIVRLRRVTKTQPVIHDLGPYDFSRPDGTIAVTADIIAVGGTATVIMVDGNGHDCYVPLTCIHRSRNKNGNHYAVKNDYALPDHPVVPAAQRGAATTVRMDTPSEELQKADPTLCPSYLSSFPESDPDHDPLYGLRLDVESTNRDAKSQLRDKRSITATENNNRYQAVAFHLVQLARALVANANRTSSHHTDIFGNYLGPEPEPTHDRTPTPAHAKSHRRPPARRTPSHHTDIFGNYLGPEPEPTHDRTPTPAHTTHGPRPRIAAPHRPPTPQAQEPSID